MFPIPVHTTPESYLDLGMCYSQVTLTELNGDVMAYSPAKQLDQVSSLHLLQRFLQSLDLLLLSQIPTALPPQLYKQNVHCHYWKRTQCFFC